MPEALKVLVELAKYEMSVVPDARREIRRWANAAVSIPDPVLREIATGAIAVDASNAEAAAAFAVMTPRSRRRAVVELLVAYQILLDYVDALGERLLGGDLVRGFAAGVALTAALEPPESPVDLDPLGDDGGYLADLVRACRRTLWQLPAAVAVVRETNAAALRCAEALAHTHAAAEHGTTDRLRAWATLNASAGYTWWEIAAGGNSDLAVLALLAAAADSATTAFDAAQISAAYWPHVCVLSTLLDSLVDCERDATTGNFSFVARYADHSAMRDGLLHATSCSRAAVVRLRRRQVHAMIVCGVAAYYVSSAISGSLAAQLGPAVLAAVGPSALSIVVSLNLRHGNRSPLGRLKTTGRSSRSAPAPPGAGGSCAGRTR